MLRYLSEVIVTILSLNITRSMSAPGQRKICFCVKPKFDFTVNRVSSSCCSMEHGCDKSLDSFEKSMVKTVEAGKSLFHDLTQSFMFHLEYVNTQQTVHIHLLIEK